MLMNVAQRSFVGGLVFVLFFVLGSNRSCTTGGGAGIATPEMLQPNPGVREVAVLFPAFVF